MEPQRGKQILSCGVVWHLAEGYPRTVRVGIELLDQSGECGPGNASALHGGISDQATNPSAGVVIDSSHAETDHGAVAGDGDEDLYALAGGVGCFGYLQGSHGCGRP